MPKIPEKKVKTMEPVDMTTVRFGCNDFPKPYWMADACDAMLYHGHVIGQLKRMPARSVHGVITSPPYWNLRDYKTGEWEGGVEGCDHVEAYKDKVVNSSSTLGFPGDGGPRRIGEENTYHEAYKKQYKSVCGKCGAKRIDQQIGAEPLHDCGTHGKDQCGRCFVCSLVGVCREVYRVLRDDGTFFLNLGDTYGDGGNLCGVPWRVALALQADGWVLRSDMPWVRRNSMPESVGNRPNKSLEYFFMLVKSDDYYFDMESVKFVAVRGSGPLAFGTRQADAIGKKPSGNQLPENYNNPRQPTRNYRNSDLWFASIEEPHGVTGVDDEIVGIDTPTQGYPGSHFATFSSKLIEPFILAGTSEYGCCSMCGKQYDRIVNKVPSVLITDCPKGQSAHEARLRNGKGRGTVGGGKRIDGFSSTVGWRQACVCRNASVEPCIVLDPFAGSGTTPATAVQHGRKGIGIDLNETYLIDHAIPRVTNAIKGTGAVKSKKVEVVIQANDVPKAKNVFGKKG